MYRVKAVAGRDQLPIGRRLESSRSLVQPWRSRSWLSTALARNEDISFDQNYTRTALKEKAGESPGNALSISEEDAAEKSREQFGKQTLDSISHSEWDRDLERKGRGHALETPVAEEGSNHSLPREEERSLSYDEKNYIATSRLYQRLLGDEFDWKEVVEILLAMPQAQRKVGYGRDEIERPSVARLVEVLKSDTVPTTQHLFRLYRDIPAPGVAKLSKCSRGYLLRRLANPPTRRWADARRYLALVDDMVIAGLPMSRSLWASAIHFAGRGTGSGKVLRRDLVRAIGLWQQMEHVARIPADDVIFDILFDVAVKAGQYTVAGRLEEEMTRRGINFSRFGMMSKIFFYGLRKDVQGISQTFEKFVKSGGIVDTVVLNCLCASYLRAGKYELAEQLYTRMIEAQAASRKNNPSPDDVSGPVLSSEFLLYRTHSRRLGRLLNKAGSLQKHLPEYHRAIQKSLPMTPDTRTFYIFLRHFSHETGQLNMFMSVLRDMEDTFTVPPRHIVYMLLFEGFGIHGRRKKSWSAERLRLTWHAYLRALRDSKSRLDSLSKGTKPSKMVWENPLGTSSVMDVEVDIPESDPGGFYMSLPSASPRGTPDLLETLNGLEESTSGPESGPGEGDQGVEEQETNEFTESEELDLDAINYQRDPTDEASFDIDPDIQHLEHLQKRVKNGVFVGRKMIIVILRAFGACCGPKEVLEVWLQLERLWDPDHRKANDVFAVKEELDRQMSMDPPHNIRYP